MASSYPNQVAIEAAPLCLSLESAAKSKNVTVRQQWLVFAAAALLVSVPVFLQAPLVRQLPFLSLVMTLGWIGLGWALLSRRSTEVWGDLLIGFSWSWFAGSIYWGWFRWEPLIHLPIESICLPLAFWCLWRRWGLVGSMFYLGSLLGTAVTDLYFFLTGLIPHWRQLMLVEPELARPIFQQCLIQIKTFWGAGWAAVLVAILLGIGFLSLRSSQLCWWAFGGAVLSTILVDSLFWLAASIA